MELNRHGDYRYTLHLRRESGSFQGYILQILQPYGVIEQPRLAARYDLPDTFCSEQEAFNFANQAAAKLASGELSPIHVRLKQAVKDYRLLAGAVFRIVDQKWEPTLIIKSEKAANKGATQEFNDAQSALRRNLFDNPESAAKFALQFGERVVLGFVGGLKI